MGGTHSAVQPDDSLQGSGAVRPSSSFGVVWKGACSTSCGTIGSMLIVGLVEFIEFRLRSPSRFQAHSTRIAGCTRPAVAACNPRAHARAGPPAASRLGTRPCSAPARLSAPRSTSTRDCAHTRLRPARRRSWMTSSARQRAYSSRPRCTKSLSGCETWLTLSITYEEKAC